MFRDTCCVHDTLRWLASDICLIKGRVWCIGVTTIKTKRFSHYDILYGTVLYYQYWPVLSVYIQTVLTVQEKMGLKRVDARYPGLELTLVLEHTKSC